MYLKVDFGDNDFGLIVEWTLKRLWKFIRENNDDVQIRHMGNENVQCLADIFVNLHKHGYLVKLITKGYDCEYNWSQIEYCTRGLYKDTELYDDQKEALEPKLEVISNYLSCEISFHPNKKFSKIWNNGESAWLNLNTGKAGIF